jgi:hypothetical protein
MDLASIKNIVARIYHKTFSGTKVLILIFSFLP